MHAIIISLLTLSQNPGAGNIVAAGVSPDGQPKNLNTDDGGTLQVSVSSSASQKIPYSQITSYVTGSNAYAAATADFNLDGNPDIILSNSGGSNVTLFLGNGDGSLQAGQSITVGASPRMIAVADFNADGCPDWAVSNKTDGSVSVFLNTKTNGVCTAKFTRSALIATGLSNPQAIAAGPFGNSSTTPGIVVSSRTGTSMKSYPGNGDGTFGAATTLTGPSEVFQLVLADLNTDGNMDIVAIGNSDNVVGALFGASNGTWGALVVLGHTLGAEPSGIVVADFNNDAVPDIATTDQNGLDIFLGNNNHFTSPAYALGIPTAYVYSLANGSDGQGVAVGDFNGDGYADLAVAVLSNNANFGNGIQIYSGNGTGTFVPTDLLQLLYPGVPPSTNPLYPITADINHDGHPDFIVPSFPAASSEPAMFTLMSTAITQIAPTLGTTFYVTPSPGTNFSGSRGPATRTTTCLTSQYATYLGSLANRTSFSVVPQHEAGTICIGGPNVVVAPGLPFSRSDAGFLDAGPGVAGTCFTPSSVPGIALNEGTQGNDGWGILVSGAEDCGLDGGWTVTTELP